MRPIIILSLLGIVLLSCGEKLPLPTDVRDDDGGRLTDTTMAPVLPHWTAADGIPFVRPFGVTVGYDRTIYICDTGNDRIVRLTPNGEFIESYPIPQPHAVAQDRAFSLAAVNSTPQIWLRRATGGGFAPFAELDSTYRCASQPNAPPICYWDVPRFESITSTLDANKSVFYAVAVGRIYVMLGDFLEPTPQGILYPVVDSGGAFGDVYNPTGVAFGIVRDQRRLFVAQYPGIYGVQYLALPEYLPALPDSGQDVFRMPLVDTKYLAVDEQGNVFVLHRANGLVMMFDKDGQYVLTFGRKSADDLGLFDPCGIACYDDMVLIADTKNNRIARYQLTAVPQN
ncbi:MAG TPA: hypothetical protein VNN55_04990 [bacterium]|nr:hypothetical protein [bacterium]